MCTAEVRHLYFTAFIVGASLQAFDQIKRMLAFKTENLPKEVRAPAVPRIHLAAISKKTLPESSPTAPSMHACMACTHAQERGNKELGMANRIKHLFYILLMLGLGLWWTSDVPVSSPREAAKKLAGDAGENPGEERRRNQEVRARAALVTRHVKRMQEGKSSFIGLHHP